MLRLKGPAALNPLCQSSELSANFWLLFLCFILTERLIFCFSSENYFEYDSVLFFEVWQQKPLNFNLNLFYFQLMVFSTRWLPRPDHLAEFPLYSSGPRHRRWCVQACATAPTDDLQSSMLLHLETQSFSFVLVAFTCY